MMIAAWAWVLPLIGLLFSLLGVPKKAGVVNLLGPIGITLLSVAWLLSGQKTDPAGQQGFLPFLPESTFIVYADQISMTMLALVGFVSSCVYIYSLGYMHDEERQHRFFGFLDIFVASMSLLVVSGTLMTLLVGWAGVGLASYLLVSYWWRKPGTINAGMEALAANALGDATLLTAIVLLPKGCGVLFTLQSGVCTSVDGGASTIAWLLVIAAFAKSAQGPLYFWLPSAMAGPTPVSALLHSATMVAAGVYLLVRTHPVLAAAPDVMHAVACIGVATAFVGGLLSLAQRNFKRGLAFSSVSQLGYMMAALGVGAPFAAFFHLVTHAFFKALLFLCSGVVIHSTHGEENLSELGGLKKLLPQVHIFYLIGSLALAGVPLLSGALSKDLILEAAMETPWMGYTLLAGALITGLYSGRLYFTVFHGELKTDPHHFHKPATSMIAPLAPLALGALLAGYIEVPSGAFSHFLAGSGVLQAPHEPAHLFSMMGVIAGALGIAGFALSAFWPKRPSQKAILGPAPWVDFILDELSSVVKGLARWHSGSISRYVLMTFVGTLVVLFLVARS